MKWVEMDEMNPMALRPNQDLFSLNLGFENVLCFFLSFSRTRLVSVLNRPRILGVGCKLNGVEAKVDDYDELRDSMTRWKDVAWFRLSREGNEDGKDLESKIDDVMVTRSLQGGVGAACNVWGGFKQV
ncbi:hypothetical protein Tco_0592379 [Tanacetum coccineum]